MTTADIADWAVSSPLIDGVIFPPKDRPETVPVLAVAIARGFRGYGKGTTQSAALAAAVGEALEQFAAYQPCGAELIKESFAGIADRAFDPRWLCLYRPDQYQRAGFPYRPFDPNRPLHWVKGRWLDSDGGVEGEVYVPASAVFMNDDFASEALCQVTSNGLGAGTSVEAASRSAALELYERDSFLTSWIARCNAIPLPLANIEADVAEAIRQREVDGAKIELYQVAPGDPAFVVVCVGLGDCERWPAVTLGLGAGADLRQAITRAVLEHGQTGPFLADQWRRKKMRIPNSRADIHSLLDQAAYYCDPAHFAEFDKWRSGSRRRASSQQIDTMSARGCEARIAIVELTPPELADTPFRVVRAIGRGLQPIWAGFGFERTFTNRLECLLDGREPNLAPIPIC